MANSEEILALRKAVSGIDLTASSHLAANEPDTDQIFSPHSHASALDFSRSLVVGNRGVGKSFWSAVLAHKDTRNFVALSYPRLSLEKLDVYLGFHEAAGKREDFTPSTLELQSLLQAGREPEDIWRAVLIRTVGRVAKIPTFSSVSDAVDWLCLNPLEAEAVLRRADKVYADSGKRFLLHLIALDEIGRRFDASLKE